MFINSRIINFITGVVIVTVVFFGLTVIQTFIKWKIDDFEQEEWKEANKDKNKK